MYRKLQLRDSVRVPPDKLGSDLEAVVIEALQEKLEGRVDKDLGVYVAVTGVHSIGEGKIIPGDGGAYYDVQFDALTFLPEVNELNEGEIVEIVEFGAFVSAGPLDALLHVSQIADEYISYDEKQSRLVGKEGGIALNEGDAVRTRIVTVSLNERNPRESKIGMTMRQPALGKKGDIYRSEEMQEHRSEYLKMLEEERKAREAAEAAAAAEAEEEEEEEAEEAAEEEAEEAAEPEPEPEPAAEEPEPEEPQEVECRECGRTFKQITASHLRTHDMDMDEYKEKHGESVPTTVER